MKRSATTVHDLRACELCALHIDVDGELHCRHEQHRVPCRLARYGAEGGVVGGCGRDARHLKWEAIDVVRPAARPTTWPLAA